MRLVKTTIEGYRSIKEPLEVHLDPRVTVALGANDHGKSNLLDAFLHLNPDHRFDAERDLNWDRLDESDSLPRVTYELRLDDREIEELREAERRSREGSTMAPVTQRGSREPPVMS